MKHSHLAYVFILALVLALCLACTCTALAAEDLTVRLGADLNRHFSGAYVTWTYTISGGVPPYDIRAEWYEESNGSEYVFNMLDMQDIYGTENTIGYFETHFETDYDVEMDLRVNDSAGNSADTYVHLPNGKPSNVTGYVYQPSDQRVKEDHAFQFYATINMSSPIYTMEWYVKQPGDATFIQASSSMGFQIIESTDESSGTKTSYLQGTATKNLNGMLLYCFVRGLNIQTGVAKLTVESAQAVEPALTSVNFSASSVQVGKNVTITAVTNTAVTKLTMYAENGTTVKTWTGGYTDSGTTRTWKVTYAFGGAGSRTLSFKGAAANGTVTAAKTATITVTAAPTLSSVKFSASSVQVGKSVTITAVTSTNVTSLTMYAENGSAVKTWTGGYTDSGTTRTWKVTYAFGGAGSRTLSFRGTGANGTATASKSVSITVTK